MAQPTPLSAMKPKTVNYASTLQKPFGSASRPPLSSFRRKLSNYAWRRDWKLMSRWMDPTPRVNTIFSPDILATTPLSDLSSASTNMN
jgi:hypothetical protein